MKNAPSLSIIIPSWNQGKYIKRTLLSILKQEYVGEVEIIISDGGSTDETVAVLKEFGDIITWWSAKDKGFVDAVMKGTAKASGEILAIQSSDDYYLPGAFNAMALAFQQNPDAGFVSGGECAIDLSNNIISSSNPTGIISPETILFNSIPPQHASFIKRNLFEKIGGLRIEVDMCADIDMWYRASHLQAGVFFPEIISVYQLHPDQRTVLSDKWYPNLVRMVESVEQMTEYGQHFKLNSIQKKDLYSYWEMDWTTKRNFKQGKKVALRKLPYALTQSKRTNRLMAGILLPAPLKEVIKKLIPSEPNNQLYESIDLNWWNQNIVL